MSTFFSYSSDNTHDFEFSESIYLLKLSCFSFSSLNLALVMSGNSNGQEQLLPVSFFAGLQIFLFFFFFFSCCPSLMICMIFPSTNYENWPLPRLAICFLRKCFRDSRLRHPLGTEVIPFLQFLGFSFFQFLNAIAPFSSMLMLRAEFEATISILLKWWSRTWWLSDNVF